MIFIEFISLGKRRQKPYYAVREVDETYYCNLRFPVELCFQIDSRRFKVLP